MSGPLHAPAPSIRLYFAYGNNLCLKEMARRCPSSVYIGRAVLPDHYWHINQRGVANIVRRAGFAAHGLVYEIGVEDEIRLDKSEGVHYGHCSKTYQHVNLYSASKALQMPTRWLVERGGPKQVIKDARDLLIPIDARRERVLSSVLVYLNERLVRYGQAGDDYIDQMNYGIRDAITLGVPPTYFKNVVRRWIPKGETVHNTVQRWNQHSLAHYQLPKLSTTCLYRPRNRWSAAGESRYSDPKHDDDWKYRTPDIVIEVRRY
ncbi:hypothetical protein F4803DRAFT_519624 [Xylaria telfairii]|nr:hypothetical protein F4803DRAFT_519624 [Xylaria telfairii]